MRKDVPPYQALDVLTLERRFEYWGLSQDIVREHEPYEVFVARNICGSRRVDVRDTNGLKTQLCRQPLLDDAHRRARVDHRGDADWYRRRQRRLPQSSLISRSGGKLELHDGADILKI